MKHLKTILIILFLSIISWYGMRALFHSGFYTSHDGWHQVARLFYFHQALIDGQFPPRWSGGLLHGFGYPLFIFSYHLPWWIAELFLRLNFTIFDAIKAVFIVTYALSGWAMYLWIRDMWGRGAGLAAATTYLFTPYRFAVMLVRANIGEAVSFFFLPLIFWALFRLHKKMSVSSIALGSVGITGFLLSHMMVVFLFALTLLSFSFVLFWKTNHKRSFLVASILMTFLGFGGAAYYLFPAIVYRPMTVFTSVYHGLYRDHFTPLTKLLYSPWGYDLIGTPGEMSRQVGVVLWAIAGITCTVLIYQIIRKRSFTSQSWLGVSFVIGFITSIFMMLPQSLFLWKLVESATLVDFPWRFLAVTTLSASVLAGWLIHQVKGKAQIVLIGVLLITSFYTTRNYLRVNQYIDIPVSTYLFSEITTNTDDEYLPSWVDRWFARKELPRIAAVSASISNLQQTSNKITFISNENQPEQVQIHYMFFPGQKAFIDEKESPISKSKQGAILVHLPAGEHRVRIQFFPTPIMRLGELVTYLSLGTMITLLAIERLSVRRRKMI